MNYKLDKHEEDLRDRYGFIVSEQGDRFVVTDRQMPRGKQKYIGGNVYLLMIQAINARNEAKAKMLKSQGKTPKLAVTDWRKLRDRPEAEIIPMKLEPEPKTKPKRGSDKGTLYAIKKLIVEQPDIKYNQIINKLKEAGIEASESTVKSCLSDFHHSIRVVKQLNRWKD